MLTISRDVIESFVAIASNRYSSNMQNLTQANSVRVGFVKNVSLFNYVNNIIHSSDLVAGRPNDLYAEAPNFWHKNLPHVKFTKNGIVISNKNSLICTVEISDPIANLAKINT